MEHTNEIMVNAVPLGLGVSVLDLGCGYGSTARYLATNFGCQVTGVNISERELELAGIRCREAGLDHLLSFEYGDFHHLGYPDGYYDVVPPAGARKRYFMLRKNRSPVGMPPGPEAGRRSHLYRHPRAEGHSRRGQGKNL